MASTDPVGLWQRQGHASRQMLRGKLASRRRWSARVYRSQSSKDEIRQMQLQPHMRVPVPNMHFLLRGYHRCAPDPPRAQNIPYSLHLKALNFQPLNPKRLLHNICHARNGLCSALHCAIRKLPSTLRLLRHTFGTCAGDSRHRARQAASQS